ncbi:recombinase family protein, partial [Wolbachia endosymbiont of Atemnus politus]|uniref:recombinase family protein n=1 Tax=Wolbachia endosymbiont of Atemnus politus TaxID=2682840 RepID=UPI0034E2CB5B
MRKLFEWIGLERVSIGTAKDKLEDMSIKTKTGMENWYPATISGMLGNSTYKGLPPFGKIKRTETASWKATGKRSKQNMTKVSTYRTDKENWIYIPVPKIV